MTNQHMLAFWLLVAGLVGSTTVTEVFGDDRAVKIKVIGVYRKADANYVRDQIESLLPAGIRGTGWSFSGNHFTYTSSNLDDTEALAKKIMFGKVIDVADNLIRVTYREDIVVPARFDDKPSKFDFLNTSPEDGLGPALQKHNGDWWAALTEMGAGRKRDKQGRIIQVDLPSSRTTDETLSHIANLKSLKMLEISMCNDITDDGVRHLASLTNLEDLDLFASAVGNRGQSHLSNLTNLRRLQLSGLGTEEGLRHLTKLTRLESLTIGYGIGYPVTAAGLGHLQNMKNLSRLRMDGCEVSDEGLAIIGGFTKLESLMLERGTMTDAGMAHLSDLAQLRWLNLRDCVKIGDTGIAHLRPLVRMTYLKLDGTRITDRGIAHLAPLARLSHLGLSNTAITDAGVEALGNRPKLWQLNLDGTKITDASLEHLSTFPELEDIRLSNTAITDAGLKHLGGMTHLTSLKINGTKITDSGMSHLANLTDLRTLAIGNTDVTGKGLQHLQGAKKLWDIHIDESGVTDEDVRRFRNR